MHSNEASDDRNIFNLAALNGQLKVVQTLSDNFVNDKKVLSEGLIYSCVGGHLDVVTWLVKNTKVNASKRGSIELLNEKQRKVQTFYFTPLTAACYNNHLNVVKYLMNFQVNVNWRDTAGYTPLAMACHRNSALVVNYLLNISDCEFNINYSNNKNGNTALHLTLSHSKFSWTSLHEACSRNDINEVRRLAYVANYMINVQDNADFTPLHTACHRGHYEIVKVLMLAGANETITNIYQQTPAQLAVREGHNNLLNLLDRVTLWDEMQKKLLDTVIHSFVVILSIHQMKRMILIRKCWCRIALVFRTVLIIERNWCLVYFQQKRHKVKKKRQKRIKSGYEQCRVWNTALLLLKTFVY